MHAEEGIMAPSFPLGHTEKSYVKTERRYLHDWKTNSAGTLLSEFPSQDKETINFCSLSRERKGKGEEGKNGERNEKGKDKGKRIMTISSTLT